MTRIEARADRRVAWSSLGTLATGVLGWVTMVVVARLAGPADFAQFAVVWAIFFGVGGGFAGLQQEVTRSVTLAEREGVRGRTQLLGPVLALTVPSVALVALVVFVDGGALGVSAGLLALTLGGGLVGLGLLTFGCGVLAARGKWHLLASVMTADALLRTVAVVLCLRGDRLDLLPLAIAIGAFAWAPLLLVASVREVARARVLDPWTGVMRRALIAMGSSGCAALLVAGFPLLVSLARPDALGASVGVVLATLILVRAPMLVVLYGFRPVILSGLLSEGLDLWRAVRRWWLALSALGILAVLLAAVLGPWVVRTVFGDGYASSATVLAALTAGSVCLAMLVVSGIALVAADRHTQSVTGWIFAVVVTLVVLALDRSAQQAILMAVVVGPVAGLAVHGISLSQHSSRRGVQVGSTGPGRG